MATGRFLYLLSVKYSATRYTIPGHFLFHRTVQLNCFATHRSISLYLFLCSKISVCTWSLSMFQYHMPGITTGTTLLNTVPKWWMHFNMWNKSNTETFVKYWWGLKTQLRCPHSLTSPLHLFSKGLITSQSKVLPTGSVGAFLRLESTSRILGLLSVWWWVSLVTEASIMKMSFHWIFISHSSH